MRTEKFRGILLSTLLVTSVIASLSIATLTHTSLPASSQVEETYFIKECMPDLGQHCVNWCWTAAAANSIYWWSQNGYPELIDDPATADPDNKYITDPLRACPACPSGGYYRLLDEIAFDCGHEYCESIFDNEYFYGLQKFIKDQGAPLVVHEIVDPDNVWSPPPPIDNIVIYRPPTLEDYQRELERCQDVLLWLNFRHYDYGEDTDHVVTGVGFDYENNWILVSDPWTPGVPDHNNLLDLKLYDNLLVINSDPLWVLYAGMPVQVSKLVYISPLEPECGVEVTIEPEHKRGTPGTWLTFVVSVHNTGNIVDNYFLSVVPDGWPDVYLDDGPFLNVEPCETRYMALYVHIPENALPCTHKEIVVVAESEFCGATDNDNALVQVVSKYLHNVDPGEYPLEPGNWLDTVWHEIYPNYDYYYYHLSSWVDTNLDLAVSPGDTIDMENVENENDITWYYVKDVTCTLVLEWYENAEEDTWLYLEYENGWDNYCWAWWDPLDTQWNEIRPEFCNRYLLVDWYDSEPYDEVLGWCDWVLLEDKVTGEYIELHVVEIATDLVLCEITECGVEVTIEPEHKRGTPGNEVFFYVSVHNTGTIQDNYILSIEPNGWPEEYFYLDNYRLENVEPCQTVTTYLEVFIPENALPCTHKEIVVVAESEFCGATDNDNALIQVVSKYLHHVDPGGLLEPYGNWLDTVWHEIRPIYCQYYLLNSWEDTNLDGVVSPGDQIDLMDESEEITWYYVKDVTATLVVEEELGGYQWYLELEGGWENYWDIDDILMDPENTQWNMIRPYFCTQWRLSYWMDDGDGYLDYCDYVYIEMKPFFDIEYEVHVVDVATDLVLCEIPENWTGSADFSLKNLYTVNVEKILDLNVGSKLVVKFYDYSDAYENENVIETFVPPAHVEENENARHPEGLGVRKARLDLTTADTGNVISTIASFTVCKIDLETRFMDIPFYWSQADAAGKVELETEFMAIPFYWSQAPS